MQKIKLIELKEWECIAGTFYSIHLPRLFTFECSTPEDFRKLFNWQLLLRVNGPCADKWGSHHFFGAEAHPKAVVRSTQGFVIYVREDRDSYGNWKDAVYEVQPSGEANIWIARLLLHNRDHPEDLSKPCDHHLRFELKSLDGNKLQILQHVKIKDGTREEREETLTIFNQEDHVIPREWLRTN